MLTKRWMQFASGFAGFAAAHVIEAAKWRDWFQGQYAPWFLNSGRAVLFTSICLFIVGAVATIRSTRPFALGLLVGAGAAAAMVVILFGGGNAGTIFPIVVATGGAVVVASAVAGALAGAAVGAR